MYIILGALVIVTIINVTLYLLARRAPLDTELWPDLTDEERRQL